MERGASAPTTPARRDGSPPHHDRDREPRYAVTAVAVRCGVQVRTLRRYERAGLVAPVAAGVRRLYSEADVERVLLIQRLVSDLGVNLAGAEVILHMREQLLTLQRELRTVRDLPPGR